MLLDEDYNTLKDLLLNLNNQHIFLLCLFASPSVANRLFKDFKDLRIFVIYSSDQLVSFKDYISQNIGSEIIPFSKDYYLNKDYLCQLFRRLMFDKVDDDL